MENVLQGIPNVIVYIDDILVTGANEEEHLKTLSLVLDRLEKAGFRARKSKCQFMVPSVSYLGHLIDQFGLHPLQEKVKAVKEAPNPKNVSELKSYLGLLMYYSKFYRIWQMCWLRCTSSFAKTFNGNGLILRRKLFKPPRNYWLLIPCSFISTLTSTYSWCVMLPLTELALCLLIACLMAPSDPLGMPHVHCLLLNATTLSWREKLSP